MSPAGGYEGRTAIMPITATSFSVSLFPVAVALGLTSVLAAQAPALAPSDGPQPPAAMATIASRELLAHATLLASDDLGGRLTGSPGQIAAAKYIAGHFAWLGLEPLGDETAAGRSFYQHYGVTRTSLLPASTVAFGDVGWRQGFAVLGGGAGEVTVEGELRFLALGHSRGPQSLLADGETLENKVPVVLVKAPRGNVGKQLTAEEKFGMLFFSFGKLGNISKSLGKKGAAAVLFVMVDDEFGFADVLNYVAVAPGKDLLAPRFRGADAGMAQMGAMIGGGSKVPSVFLTVEHSRTLLDALGLDLDGVRAFLAGDGELPAATNAVAGRVHIVREEDDTATASNVVAVLRGSDPTLRSEAIVYSAHMDHVGRRMDGDVYNGADDNASGSAGLLAIAGAYARSAERPRRSVIFLSVSGEELGLWGSAYYADHPTWPLDRIVANINTDMIGRNGPESGPGEVTVTPSFRHGRFSTLVQRSARFGEQLGMTFTSGDKYYARSDHFNFAQKGIPVVFFCNGEHEDYHQVSDHADKLDGAKMERIARLAFWTGWATANADERPLTLGRQQDWR